MQENNDYININRKSWNLRTDLHIDSDFYDLQRFLNGKSSLNDIELNLLGNISGKSILHLQCHFGMDTLSLSRLGARVTGVDLSDNAILQARKLAEQTGSDAKFICCDIYDLPNHLDEKFDIVFTSYGTIGWLPDLSKWADIIARFLRENGTFVIAEFHPVVWMFDDQFQKINYRYFKDEAHVETIEGTYANKEAAVNLESVTWNHSLSDVLQQLIDHHLQICDFREYDYSPYDCFSQTTQPEPGKYRIAHLGNKIPMVFSVVARKKPR